LNVFFLVGGGRMTFFGGLSRDLFSGEDEERTRGDNVSFFLTFRTFFFPGSFALTVLMGGGAGGRDCCWSSSSSSSSAKELETEEDAAVEVREEQELWWRVRDTTGGVEEVVV
jgi:hypothetical protein